MLDGFKNMMPGPLAYNALEWKICSVWIYGCPPGGFGFDKEFVSGRSGMMNLKKMIRGTTFENAMNSEERDW